MFKLGDGPWRLVSDTRSAEHFSGGYEASTQTKQHEAAAALIDHDNGDILAWLKLARSARRIEPISEQRPSDAHLSPLQIHALFALKDCPNDKLLGLLELARLCRVDSIATAFEGGTSRDSGLGNNFPISLAQSDSTSVESKLWTELTGKVPSRPDLNPLSRTLATDGLSRYQPDRSVNSTRSIKHANHYWCTVCEEPNSYKDSGNWKKHEKAHETIFVCGLDDGAESSSVGQSHASKPFTCKRRDIMVNHLNRSHGILETQRGRDLADQWRHTVKKQAWSCGFCIVFFSTFQDRLKHIDNGHFRRHQSIHEWDPNKVILGLLQQPKMKEIWKTRMVSLPHWVHPEDLAWDRATARDLRTTLEIGPLDDHHANTLADTAYSASQSNEGSWPLSGTTHANRHSNATARASFLSSANPYQAISAPMSGSGMYHQPRPPITDPTAHFVSRDSSFSRYPTNDFAFGNSMEPAMPSLDDNDRVEHNTTLFNPSQSWLSTSEPGTLPDSFEPSQRYGGQGANLSTPKWYGQ